MSSKELASLRLIQRPDVLCCSFFFCYLSGCCSWVSVAVEVGSVVGRMEVEGCFGLLGGIEVGVVYF